MLPSLSFEEEIFVQTKAALKVLAMTGVTMPVVMKWAISLSDR